MSTWLLLGCWQQENLPHLAVGSEETSKQKLLRDGLLMDTLTGEWYQVSSHFPAAFGNWPTTKPMPRRVLASSRRSAAASCAAAGDGRRQVVAIPSAKHSRTAADALPLNLT